MPTDLQEALTAAGSAALIQKQIDPVLIEYQRRYAPFVRALPTQKWGSNVYYFNHRDSLPTGGFVTDGGARPVTTSVYNQSYFNIRQFQTVGAVTGYAQAVTSDLAGSLRAKEISGAHQGLLWDLETALLWGNATSTAAGVYPEFDGLDTIVSTFSGVQQNAIDFSAQNTSTTPAYATFGNGFDLGVLDQVIDMVEQNVAMPVETSDWMFVCSPSVNSRIAQLLTNQQRYNDKVEIAPGLVVDSYRNVPIVKSSFLAPRSNVMNTPVATSQSTGGNLAAGTYYYQIAPIVSRFGEIQASAAAGPVTVTGSTNVVTLSFTPFNNSTAPVGVEGNTAQVYKVFRGTAAPATGSYANNAPTLLGYVDATVGLSTDGVTPVATTSIIDDGVNLIPANGTTQPATKVPYTGQNSGVKPLQAGWQSVYLISRDSDFIVRPYVRDMQAVDLYPTTASPDSLPFAIVSDTTLAVRGPKYLGRAANINISLAA